MDDEKVSLQDDLLAQCLEAMNTLSPDKITPEIDMAIAKVEKYIGHTVEKRKSKVLLSCFFYYYYFLFIFFSFLLFIVFYFYFIIIIINTTFLLLNTNFI